MKLLGATRPEVQTNNDWMIENINKRTNSLCDGRKRERCKVSKGGDTTMAAQGSGGHWLRHE